MVGDGGDAALTISAGANEIIIGDGFTALRLLAAS
jgi:hypothetical protein